MTLTPEKFNKLATKDDLKNFATKDEHINLSNKTDKLITKVIDLDERVQSIEERMATKDDISNIMEVMDKMVSKLDNIEHNFISNQVALDRFEERIIKVEKQLELKPYI